MHEVASSLCVQAAVKAASAAAVCIVKNKTSCTPMRERKHSRCFDYVLRVEKIPASYLMNCILALSTDLRGVRF